jgi:two-component system cell cycle sensor histidine kinase/response regulator CckA
VVYGAARAHEGWVEVESTPGGGSSFHVLIPVTAAVDQAPAADVGELASGGGETILLADDESMLRRVARLMLERYGFRVIEACDGLEAVSIFERRQREIDLLLLDVTMPNLDGLAALEKMRKIAPGIPAIMISGLPESVFQFSDRRLTLFLPKPFEAGELVKDVHRTLGTDGHGAD